MRTLGRFMTCGSALALLGCRDVTSVSDGTLTARHAGHSMTLQNSSATQVFYLVMDQNVAALADWVACVDPTCPSLGPFASQTVSDPRQLANLPATTAYIVYWWHARPDGHGGFAPDSLRNLLVPVRH